MFLFIAIIILLFLAINFVFAPSSPYAEKGSPFESGFSSFHQTRSPFHLSFVMYALVYLILDLELILLYPYAMSTNHNGIYGLVIMLIFTLIISVGFIYEIGSGALHINSRQFNSRPSEGKSQLTSNLTNFPPGARINNQPPLKSHIFSCYRKS